MNTSGTDNAESPSEGHYVEAVRTTKHPSSKIGATRKKSPQNRRHSTCKVATNSTLRRRRESKLFLDFLELCYGQLFSFPRSRYKICRLPRNLLANPSVPHICPSNRPGNLALKMGIYLRFFARLNRDGRHL